MQKTLKRLNVKSVMTIDKSQGIDRHVIVVSCVVHESSNRLLQDLKRLNVAFTRAKKKLVIVGSAETLKKICPLEYFLGMMEDRGWVLPVESMGEEMREYFPKGSDEVFKDIQCGEEGSHVAGPRDLPKRTLNH